jgi:hypothetical protein
MFLAALEFNDESRAVMTGAREEAWSDLKAMLIGNPVNDAAIREQLAHRITAAMKRERISNASSSSTSASLRLGSACDA